MTVVVPGEDAESTQGQVEKTVESPVPSTAEKENRVSREEKNLDSLLKKSSKQVATGAKARKLLKQEVQEIVNDLDVKKLSLSEKASKKEKRDAIAADLASKFESMFAKFERYWAENCLESEETEVRLSGDSIGIYECKKKKSSNMVDLTEDGKIVSTIEEVDTGNSRALVFSDVQKKQAQIIWSQLTPSKTQNFLSSVSAEGIWDCISNEVKNDISSSWARSTLSEYNKVLDKWFTYARNLNLPLVFPFASGVDLVNFILGASYHPDVIAHGGLQSYKWSTFQSLRAALSALHKVLNCDVHTIFSGVATRLFASIKRNCVQTVDQKLTISLDDFLDAVSDLRSALKDSTFGKKMKMAAGTGDVLTIACNLELSWNDLKQAYKWARWLLTIIFGFGGAMRNDELRFICFEDILRVDKSGVLIYIKHMKNDQLSCGHHRFIPARPFGTDPSKIIDSYLAVYGCFKCYGIKRNWWTLESFHADLGYENAGQMTMLTVGSSSFGRIVAKDSVRQDIQKIFVGYKDRGTWIEAFCAADNPNNLRNASMRRSGTTYLKPFAGGNLAVRQAGWRSCDMMKTIYSPVTANEIVQIFEGAAPEIESPFLVREAIMCVGDSLKAAKKDDSNVMSKVVVSAKTAKCLKSISENFKLLQVSQIRTVNAWNLASPENFFVLSGEKLLPKSSPKQQQQFVQQLIQTMKKIGNQSSLAMRVLVDTNQVTRV